jgi:hypothetical protein
VKQAATVVGAMGGRPAGQLGWATPPPPLACVHVRRLPLQQTPPPPLSFMLRCWAARQAVCAWPPLAAGAKPPPSPSLTCRNTPVYVSAGSHRRVNGGKRRQGKPVQCKSSFALQFSSARTHSQAIACSRPRKQHKAGSLQVRLSVRELPPFEGGVSVQGFHQACT